MQFLAPVSVTAAVFGVLKGEAQTTTDGTELWLQNAGFVLAPFLIIATLPLGLV